MTLPFDEIIARFPGPRIPNGQGGFKVNCSMGHDKNTPSLSISPGNGSGPLFHCFGCGSKAETILEAAGLTYQDILPPREHPAKVMVAMATKPAMLPIGNKPDGAHGHQIPIITRYEIRDPGGNLVAVHVRTDRPGEEKRVHWELPDGTVGLNGTIKLVDMPLYGIDRLPADAKEVTVTEGEKACGALLDRGIPAVGSVTGASATPGDAALAPLCAFPTVYLFPDADKAGREHMERIAGVLNKLGHRDVRLIDWKAAPAKGDAFDLFELEGAADDFQVLLEEARRIGNPEKPVPLFTRRASDVQPIPIEWMWDQRLPLGKLVTIAGEPGLGKTRIGNYMASTASRGGWWPQNEGRCPRSEALIMNFEDDQADTTVPRLKAEGADLSLIHFLVAVPDEKGARSFDLSRDTTRLSHFLDQNPLIRLVIIDPITACMMGVDSHKNAEVRSALHPLAEVAQRHRVCVVAITHLNKGSGMKAMHRVTGSIAFTAAARVVFLVTKDDADPDGMKNLFIPIKNNLGNDRTGLSFRTEVVQVTPDIMAPKIAWGDTVTVTADDALTPPDEGKDALKDAKEFLLGILADGPLPAEQVFEDAKDAGVGVRALKSAKLKLGVQSRKSGMEGGWEWLLR